MRELRPPKLQVRQPLIENELHCGVSSHTLQINKLVRLIDSLDLLAYWAHLATIPINWAHGHENFKMIVENYV